MTTTHPNTLRPLSYPDGWLDDLPSKVERVGLWVPILGWSVAAFLESRRNRPAELHFDEQLAARPEILESVWASDRHAAVARKVIECCMRVCDWQHARFISADPFEIMVQWRTGDLCELEALMNIEDAFELGPDDEVAEKLLKMEFVEVVDYLMARTPGRVIHELLQSGVSPQESASRPNQHPFGLSRHPVYRLVLGAVATLVLVFAIDGLLGFDELLGPRKGVMRIVLTILVGEFFVALIVVSSLSLIWAVAAPVWVENALSRYKTVVEIGIYLFIPGLMAFLECIR